LKRVGFAVLLLAGVAHAQQLDLIWEKRGEGPQSRFGGTIFGLGDRNHDGYDDFAVFAWGSGEYGNPSEPMLEMFYGGNPPSTTPFYIFRGIPEEGLTIWGAYEIGDIDGDGLMDWVIGYRNDDFSERWTHFYIGATNLPTDPSWIIPYRNTEWNLDVTPRNIGDFNGDGFDDIYLHGHGRISADPGRGDVFFGSTLLDTIVDGTICCEGEYVWPSSGGSGVDDAHGDLNGDGFDDILNLRWLTFGTFEVFWGNVAPNFIADTIGFLQTSNVSIPHIMSDLNNDGRDEITYAINSDQIAVFLGNEVLSTQPDFILNFQGCGESDAPWKIEAIGDLNADGFQDMAVTNDFCPGGSGTISLYFSRSWLSPDPRFTFRGSQFGTSGLREAARVGDVNGDGVDDTGIGGFNNVDFRGWAGILAGNPNIVVSAEDAPAPVVDELELSVYPNPFNIQTTISIGGLRIGKPCTLSIFNVLGQQVLREEIATHNGNIKYTLNATAWATGLYLVEVSTGTHFAGTKMLLIK
jgi:hypothetical protein